MSVRDTTNSWLFRNKRSSLWYSTACVTSVQGEWRDGETDTVSQCIMESLLLSRFSRVRLSATLWTVARQAPLCLGFSRQESWSGLPFPSRGNLLDPGIEPMSLMSLALTGRFFTPEPSGKAPQPFHSHVHWGCWGSKDTNRTTTSPSVWICTGQ